MGTCARCGEALTADEPVEGRRGGLRHLRIDGCYAAQRRRATEERESDRVRREDFGDERVTSPTGQEAKKC